MTQPSPSEAKKPNRKILAVALLVVAIAIGTVGAIWWTQQARYTQVKIFTGDLARVTLGGYNYTFTYNWWWAHDLIGVDVQGSSAHYDFNSTQGSRYQCLSIEILVSEVHDDYIILLVRPL